MLSGSVFLKSCFQISFEVELNINLAETVRLPKCGINEVLSYFSAGLNDLLRF
jgi:hypothetical protein